jgi:hypothetical protein
LSPPKVLPRHGVVPEEDIFYYRILLRLSLDPEPDWWAKYDRETAAARARGAGGSRPASPDVGGWVSPADAGAARPRRHEAARRSPLPVLVRGSAEWPQQQQQQQEREQQQQERDPRQPRQRLHERARREARARSTSPGLSGGEQPWRFLTDDGGWEDDAAATPDSPGSRRREGRFLKAAVRSTSASPLRGRHLAAASQPAPSSPLAVSRLSGRHSPAFNEGVVAAEAAFRPSPAPADETAPPAGGFATPPAAARCHSATPLRALSSHSRLGPVVRGRGQEPDGRTRLRSRSCSPSMGLRSPQQHLAAAGDQHQRLGQRGWGWQRRSLDAAPDAAGFADRRSTSPERYVLAPLCTSQVKAAAALRSSGGRLSAGGDRPGAADAEESGAASPPPAGQCMLLSALLPPEAAAERMAKDAASYLAFKQRLGLFALWKEHARAAQDIRRVCLAAWLLFRARHASCNSIN